MAGLTFESYRCGDHIIVIRPNLTVYETRIETETQKRMPKTKKLHLTVYVYETEHVSGPFVLFT
jgi:hypothetical protein